MTAAQVAPTLSPRDVAELTGLGYQTVLAEIHDGRLRARKIRNHYLITTAAFHDWLEPDEQPAPARSVQSSPRPSRRSAAAGSVAALTAIEEGARP